MEVSRRKNKEENLLLAMKIVFPLTISTNTTELIRKNPNIFKVSIRFRFAFTRRREETK